MKNPTPTLRLPFWGLAEHRRFQSGPNPFFWLLTLKFLFLPYPFSPFPSLIDLSRRIQRVGATPLSLLIDVSNFELTGT